MVYFGYMTVEDYKSSSKYKIKIKLTCYSDQQFSKNGKLIAERVALTKALSTFKTDLIILKIEKEDDFDIKLGAGSYNLEGILTGGNHGYYVVTNND